MATFPRLKTGAIAQYPATRGSAFATADYRFLDGSEQRYRERGQAARRWFIRLDVLDDTELAALESFFVAQQGRYGSFAFEDPWDGTVHADCSFEQDELTISVEGERRGTAQLAIRENEE